MVGKWTTMEELQSRFVVDGVELWPELDSRTSRVSDMVRWSDDGKTFQR